MYLLIRTAQGNILLLEGDMSKPTSMRVNACLSLIKDPREYKNSHAYHTGSNIILGFSEDRDELIAKAAMEII